MKTLAGWGCCGLLGGVLWIVVSLSPGPAVAFRGPALPADTPLPPRPTPELTALPSATPLFTPLPPRTPVSTPLPPRTPSASPTSAPPTEAPPTEAPPTEAPPPEPLPATTPTPPVVLALLPLSGQTSPAATLGLIAGSGLLLTGLLRFRYRSWLNSPPFWPERMRKAPKMADSPPLKQDQPGEQPAGSPRYSRR